MAGEAKTTSFMLSTATLMLGPMASLYALNPAAHSVGLAKDVTCKTNPTFTDLTQGTQNSKVYSKLTSQKVEVSASIFEYTPANIAYSLSLDGSTISRNTGASAASTVATAYVAPTPPTLLGAATTSVATGDGTKFTVGSTWMVQPGGADDSCYIRTVASVTTDTVTWSEGGFPVGLPVGTVLSKCNVIPVGTRAEPAFLSAKIVGNLADGPSDPVAILLPKVRISSGLTMAFKTGGFESIPFMLEVMDMVPTDPFYANFQSVGAQGKPAMAALGVI